MDRTKLIKACELIEEARMMLIELKRAEPEPKEEPETEEDELLAERYGALEDIVERCGDALDQLEAVE